MDPADTKVSLPRYLFLSCVLTSLLAPLIARLPGVPTRGWEWFTDYLPTAAFPLFAAFNLIPAGALYGLGKASKRAPISFWCSLAGTVAFLMWMHGTMNLRASSTAAIGLIFIPIYSVAASLIGWGVGLVFHVAARQDRVRIGLATVAGAVALTAAMAVSFYESASVASVESRFPITATSDLPLSKRTVVGCCSMGRVEALAFGTFDKMPGEEIAVLGDNSVVLLDPSDYSVKSKTTQIAGCDHSCIGMYTYLVPDGHGRTLIASSAGVADSEGRSLWRLKREGFTKLVPVRTADLKEPTFFSYQMMDRIDRHDITGNVVWSAKVHAETVGAYITRTGEVLPFAVVGHGKSRELKLFDLNGQPQAPLSIPDWASNIDSIDWPSRGHLLIGGGAWIGIIDPQGQEILRHVIEGTSFRPYHGPDGVAVRFEAKQEPYLAILSHGSSGYARSVLLIFDPSGKLVWQEELNKLRAILAVPVPKESREVLLVGGMDGVLEYGLTPSTGAVSPLKR